MEIESMINVSSDADDLKTLQREADELRESREKISSTGERDSQPRQDHEEELCEKESSAESVLLDLSDQVERYLKETEATVQEHPMISLVATFVLGVVVGQLFSRR
jgi:ElaB/YqjD/DUF883 family membrane-anchored ribosome-binding protein